MSIQLPPQSIPSSAASGTSGQRTAPRAALTMAPVDLTPLAPPSSAPRQPAKAEPGQGLATEGRQAAFAERQKALLERLRQGGAAPMAGQTGGLSEAQRSACLSVLAAVAAAAAR